MKRRSSQLELSNIRKHNFILLLIGLISICGLITLYSIQKGNISEKVFEKQILNIVIATFLYFLFLFIPIPSFLKQKKFLYFISIVLLLLPFFLKKISYLNRWLIIGPFYFQTSEFVKIPIIFFLSLYLKELYRINFFESVKLFIFLFIPFLLVILQPDMGSAFYFLFIFYCILLVKNPDKFALVFWLAPPLAILTSFNPFLFLVFIISLLVFLYITNSGFPFSAFAVFTALTIGLITPYLWNKGLKEYQRKRIITFLNPQSDPKGSGWQVIQSLVSIGSGQVTGKGFLKGSQKGLAFLPAAHTDFIFASFAEEFGFIGSIFLFSLYILLFYNLLGLFVIRESFSFNFGILLFFTLFYNFFVNIGGELGILPLTGVPLPFMSYGGSSYFVLLFLLSLFRNFQRSVFHERSVA